MVQEKSIEILNSLVEINNDRILGYQTAFDETKEADLKTLFAQLSLTSQNCETELNAEIIKMGGTPTKDVRTTGSIYRAWMDLKATLTGHDRVTILNSCEFGENVAIDTYNKVISDSFDSLDGKQQTMIIQQQKLIQADLKKVIGLRNLLLQPINPH